MLHIEDALRAGLRQTEQWRAELQARSVAQFLDALPKQGFPQRVDLEQATSRVNGFLIDSQLSTENLAILATKRVSMPRTFLRRRWHKSGK